MYTVSLTPKRGPLAKQWKTNPHYFLGCFLYLTDAFDYVRTQPQEAREYIVVDWNRNAVIGSNRVPIK